MATETTRTALAAYILPPTWRTSPRPRPSPSTILGVLDNHDTADPDTLNWGHVGDMVETRRMLKAIHDRLFAEGEYAPQAK